MKQLLNYIPVLIGVIVVSGAILMTGGFLPGNAWEEEGEIFADTQAATTPMASSLTSSGIPFMEDTLRSLTRDLKSARALTSTEASSSTTTTSASSTTSGSTVRQVVDPLPGGVYSSIRIFLDIQRIVFYKTDSAGVEYPVTTVYCSTGKASTPTRPTGESKPHKLSGRKVTQAVFSNPSKYSGSCIVRYAVEIKNPVWLHSEPYTYPGKGKPVNKAACDMGGYRALGRRVSSGCIRMCLRDAMFLYNIVRPGMNCYILSSSKGYSIPATRPIPPANPGSRNWDPTDPEWPGYVAGPPIVEPTQPPTQAPTVPNPPSSTPSTVPSPPSSPPSSPSPPSSSPEQSSPSSAPSEQATTVSTPDDSGDD